MAPSRNRGVKKPKLRDYSHLALTTEEKDAIAAVAHSIEQNPIVTAILGAVLVEHELEGLLRPKFKKLDDDAWRELQSEQGPLRSFSAKIAIGFAFSLYKSKINEDMGVVRVIRNAFAHSRKLLDFDDPLIVKELMSAHLLPAKFKKHLRKATSDSKTAKAAFIVICLRIQIVLMKTGGRASRAKTNRLKRKIARSPFTNALLGNPSYHQMGGIFGLPPTAQGLPLQSLPLGQNAGPNPLAPLGYAEALRPFLERQTPLVLREAEKNSKK
jgi:hypothetical protein